MGNYIGLIHKEADSDYGVSFPDFPGAVTAGTTLDDARAMAEEALALHIEGLVADGEAIPEPASLEEVMTDPENRDAVAILVRAKTEAPKAVRVNVTRPRMSSNRSTNTPRRTASRDQAFLPRQRRKK